MGRSGLGRRLLVRLTSRSQRSRAQWQRSGPVNWIGKPLPPRPGGPALREQIREGFVDFQQGIISCTQDLYLWCVGVCGCLWARTCVCVCVCE